MRVRLLAGVLAAIVSTACASGGSGASGTSATTQTAPARGNSRLITQQEIAALPVETIFEAIERLRPNMLRSRGAPIMVYLDGAQIGNISMLRSIQAASVKQVEYISAADATTRFGTGVAGGAILITSR